MEYNFFMKCSEYSNSCVSTFNKEDNSGDLVKKVSQKEKSGRAPTKYKIIREYKSEFTPKDLIIRIVKVHISNN